MQYLSADSFTRTIGGELLRSGSRELEPQLAGVFCATVASACSTQVLALGLRLQATDLSIFSRSRMSSAAAVSLNLDEQADPSAHR